MKFPCAFGTRIEGWIKPRHRITPMNHESVLLKDLHLQTLCILQTNACITPNLWSFSHGNHTHDVESSPPTSASLAGVAKALHVGLDTDKKGELHLVISEVYIIIYYI